MQFANRLSLCWREGRIEMRCRVAHRGSARVLRAYSILKSSDETVNCDVVRPVQQQ
jgi:hypothetical protein